MSRDIIKLDQIDVTFHQKKRTIISGQRCDHSHPRRGYLRNRWIFWSGKSTLVRVINLLQKPSAGKITIDNDVILTAE